MENLTESNESKIVEIRPVQLKRVEKANSEKLIKRHNYPKGKRVVKHLALYKELLAHQIDKSPRLRPFSI